MNSTQKREINNLLQELIQINSQNPPGNEVEIVAYIKKYLEKLGIKSSIYEFSKNRPNLVCKIKAKESKKRLLITPHIDTVPITGKWKVEALSGKIIGNKLYGRGATDCKVNVAASLYLIKKLVQENRQLKNIDLVFAFTADEETGSKYGIAPLLKVLKNIDYALVLDADEFDLIIAQKGLLHLHIDLFGKEAHGAYPERGISAVEKGVRILNDILNHKFSYKVHQLLEKPTLNIGRFCGGDKVNIVAGEAFFELDIRYLPSMKAENIIRDIETIIKKYKIKYKLRIISCQLPVQIEKDNFFLKKLIEVLKEKKIKGQLKPSFGATVMSFLQERKIPSFATGFGTHGCAHIKDEYVKLSDLHQGLDVLWDYLVKLDAYIA